MTINEYYAKIRHLSIEEYESIRKQEIRVRVAPKIQGSEEIEDEVNFQYIIGNQETDAKPIDLLASDPNCDQPTEEQINQEMIRKKQSKTITQDDYLYKESLDLIADLRATALLNVLGGEK